MIRVAALFLLIARGPLEPGNAKAGVPLPQDSGPERGVPAAEAFGLLRTALAEDGRDAARELLHELVDSLVLSEADDVEAQVDFLVKLDRMADDLGSPEESKRLCETILGLRERTLSSDHPEVLSAKYDLAVAKYVLRDYEGARTLMDQVVADRMRLLPPEHADLLEAEEALALLYGKLGDLVGGRELLEEVLATRRRILPHDHPDVLATMQSLAATLHNLGEFGAANELIEEVLVVRGRTMPAEDPLVLNAKTILAETLGALGDLIGARALEEEVLQTWTRLVPPGHPQLLDALENLLDTRRTLGDLSGVVELAEEILAHRLRQLPPEHPDVLAARFNLAESKSCLGDLAGAYALQESVLASCMRLYPPDDHKVIVAKQILAITKKILGDLPGARELEEELLAVNLRRIAPEHPDVLRTKHNLGVTKHMLGDFASAHRLFEEVLETRLRIQSQNHLALLMSRNNLAMAKVALGDLEGARTLETEALLAAAAFLPADHPEFLQVKGNLAAALHGLGDLRGAETLFEELLDARTKLLPSDHPDLLAVQASLARTKRALGDFDAARALVSSLLEGMRARARALRTQAFRAAREGASIELQRLPGALLSSAGTGDVGEVDSALFSALENLRRASMASCETAHALSKHPKLAERAREIAGLRSRLNDLVVAGAQGGESVEDWRKELVRLANERDRAERELRSRLAQVGTFVADVDASGVGAKLAPDAAAVTYLRCTLRFDRDPVTGETPPPLDALLAFVVRHGGAVTRIDLGPAGELEELVRNWRIALGRALDGRGIGAPESGGEAGSSETLGGRIRERALDPILDLAGEIRTLHVVPDDLLHLIPLDALPLGSGLVGERMDVRNEVTLARLLQPEDPAELGGSLTIAGAIDYDAEADEDASSCPPASTPPVGIRTERSLRGMQGFGFLPGSGAETESIAALYREAFERVAIPLAGSMATKSALRAAAPDTRYFHLATHGWFASEVFRSQLDSLGEDEARKGWLGAEETLTGFAPETLCGLALAGANRGRDAVGRVPGILTAEELASFDLRGCELAVLSACETHVGIRRAGQGIQSLQTALHAAGVRTAITSLWRVDDAATRRLFELFYSKLWKEKLGKADALWEAKMALRAEGHPLRDWAGWVLSGEPD